MADHPASPPNPQEQAAQPVDSHAVSKPSAEQRNQALHLVEQIVTDFEGPLPPPQMLAEYDRLIPQGADRLMRLLEARAAHRHRQEEQIVKTQLTLPARGQWIGMILCLFFGVIGWHLAINGHDGVAGLLFGTTILGLVTVFVLGRTPRRDDQSTVPERKNKRAK